MTDPVRCDRCGLPVAAWRVDRDGRTYCTSFCAKSATGDVVAGARACASPSREPTAELSAIVAELGADEVKVLTVLARRLLAGQRHYGRLDCRADGRDWRRERAEELADALVYGAIAEVAAVMGRD